MKQIKKNNILMKHWIYNLLYIILNVVQKNKKILQKS